MHVHPAIGRPIPPIPPIPRLSTIMYSGAQGKPSFVWHNCPPGPEDRVLLGFGDVLKDVDFIGGSSADNSVAGEWKQWSSATPDTIHSNTVVYVVAHCSAQVQGALQTAYTPSPSVGVVTATNGPRHITTIDHKPAAEVYNKWCQQVRVHYRGSRTD